MLFDHGPAELPTATARPREPRARAVALLGDLGRWFTARWQWLRPRTVPVLVAALGLVGVLASADYLAHYRPKTVCAPHASYERPEECVQAMPIELTRGHAVP